jgi:hypothetical protein
MSQIFELLQEMRGTVPMYVGSNSVTKLATFISGYQLALERNGLCKEDSFFLDFQMTVEQRFDVKTSHGWWGIIRFQGSDDDEAISIFWESIR